MILSNYPPSLPPSLYIFDEDLDCVAAVEERERGMWLKSPASWPWPGPGWVTTGGGPAGLPPLLSRLESSDDEQSGSPFLHSLWAHFFSLTHMAQAAAVVDLSAEISNILSKQN